MVDRSSHLAPAVRVGVAAVLCMVTRRRRGAGPRAAPAASHAVSVCRILTKVGLQPDSQVGGWVLDQPRVVGEERGGEHGGVKAQGGAGAVAACNSRSNL